tara:strand:- start:31471 stop:31929 length:459 start_codon:yes stop_codon:yes gene_type:complete
MSYANWNGNKNFRATLTLTSEGEDAVFGGDTPLRKRTTIDCPYNGKVMQTGSMRLTGEGTKDNLALAALAGENDRAYLYLFNTSTSTSNQYNYVKVGLRAAHDTDSASGDWFATLPPFGQLFIPISDMQSVDLEVIGTSTPIIEYMLLQKDA